MKSKRMSGSGLNENPWYKTVKDLDVQPSYHVDQPGNRIDLASLTGHSAAGFFCACFERWQIQGSELRMAKERNSLGNKLRFEVFKRDKFTCQYCGKRAPDVVLNVDHIEPVAKGGDNHITNLITSCWECNSGKSDRLLNDDTVVQLQMDQLSATQEVRNQLDMIRQWRAECRSVNDEIGSALSEEFKLHFGYSPSQVSRDELVRLSKRVGVEETIDCIEIASATYYDADETTAIKKIGGIAVSRKRESEKPGSGRLPYILGILRNRLSYVNTEMFYSVLDVALDKNVNIQSVETLAKTARSWTKFITPIQEFIGDSAMDMTNPFEDETDG